MQKNHLVLPAAALRRVISSLGLLGKGCSAAPGKGTRAFQLERGISGSEGGCRSITVGLCSWLWHLTMKV
jgi:hypothetical protein